MRMMVHITGRKFGKVELNMILLKRQFISIRGVTEVNCVGYSSHSKVWMEGVKFQK